MNRAACVLFGCVLSACSPPVADSTSAPDVASALANEAAIRIACGATTPYTDASGNVWLADTGYTGGNALHTTPAPSIVGSTDPALYGSERWGTFHYSLAVPNGSYAVNLKFAETYLDGAGEREFDVAINGQAVLTGFDIAAFAGGVHLPVDEQFTVDVTTGSIDIDFSPGAIQSPKVDAIEVMASTAQTSTLAPFFRTPAQIPGRIAAVDYDWGPREVAYHDASSVNEGGVYRASEGVGIKASNDVGGGYAVGWMSTGDWMDYAVQVAKSGTYALALRAASGVSTGALHLDLDGKAITGSIHVTDTGAWSPEQWTTLASKVALTAGTHVLRVVVDSQYLDLDWISFVPSTAAPTGPAPSPPPANTVTTAPDFFGMVWNDNANVPTVPSASARGVLRVWDVGASWQEMNTAPGVYDWTALDERLAVAAEKGYTVLYTFGRVPVWISSDTSEPCESGNGCSAPPSDLETGDATFKAFVTALVKHSLSQSVHIKYYNLWNEPNNDIFWRGSTPAEAVPELAIMMKDAATIIRALDPSAIIVSPSPDGYEPDKWLDAYYAAGGGANQSVMSFHTPSTVAATMTELAAVRAVMAKYGDADKPVYVTEGNWGMPNNTSLTNDEKVAFLGTEYIELWAASVGQYDWYAWDNTSIGTLELGGTIEPAGVAYGLVFDWLVGSTHTPSPCTTNSAGTFICALAKSGVAQQIMWNPSSTLSVAAPASFAHYHTLDNAQTNAIVGGHVTIGSKPILLVP